MVGLSSEFLGLLSAGNSEVFCAREQGLLYQHPVTPCLTGVKPLLNPLSYCLGCGEMTGLLQNNSLKDYQPLQVPQSVPHPAQLFHQGHHKASPDLPNWIIVAPGGHDRKVTPPPLTSLIVPYAAMKFSARVRVNPVSVDLFESEVLWGQGVARNIIPIPLPVLLIQKLFYPASLLRPSGLCLGRSGEVTTW